MLMVAVGSPGGIVQTKHGRKVAVKRRRLAVKVVQLAVIFWHRDISEKRIERSEFISDTLSCTVVKLFQERSNEFLRCNNRRNSGQHHTILHDSWTHPQSTI